MLKTKFTYKTVLDGIVFLFICTALNKSLNGYCFLSLPYFIASCYNKKNPLFFSVLFLISFILISNYNILIASTLSAVILSIIFIIYNAKNKQVGGEIIIYSILSCLPYVFLRGDVNLVETVIKSVISVVLSIIFIPAVNLISVSRFKNKIDASSYVCLAVLVFPVEMGVIRLFSVFVLKGLVLFAILFCGVIYKNQFVSVVVAIILGIAPSVFESTFSYLSAFSIIAVLSSLFIKNSRIVSAFSVLALDTVFLVLLKAYGSFTTVDVFYSIIPIIIFLFIPKGVIDKVQKVFYSFNEKALSKYAINKTRNALSNKLYGVSDVFNEMHASFTKLKETVSGQSELMLRVCDEIIYSVCNNCPSKARCRNKNFPSTDELMKIVSVGVAKNRVSLIDLTKTFTENCSYTNSVIFEMNALITKYKEKIKELDDLSKGKELIKMQSEGIAEVLKGMAFDMSKTLTYDTELEKKLFSALRKNGVTASEIMVYNDFGDVEVDFVLPKSCLNKSTFIKTVSNVLQKEMSVVSKTGLSESSCAVSLKASPETDASFGLAISNKDGSKKSGDTHSLLKISEGKFLIALSDGMGSGAKAQNTSATAISLIESFYKAGLNSNLILSMVNKILALNTDDNFSAMDVLTIDLFNLSADFIKIGAPQSYVITDTCIKLIEGNSLPLGILDDLKPTGCTTDLSLGSTIVLITDGISEAFTSSTDFINYLQSVSSKNPQTLADGILNKAIELNGGVKKDDMTVLCVRIFKKQSHKTVA
ncbi:MAG: SpoIIE family protein phosphatase [Clostridia bacterium]|nr:SpoIIE family protein phosphatase [Clostridia bacterium]